MTEPSGESRRSHGMSLGLAAVLLLAAVVVLGAFFLDLDEAGWIQRIEDEIRAWGPFGVVASIGLMVVHSFVPFPAEFVAIANGMLFGVVWGVVITWTGAMLGAFAAFGLARLLGRPFVAKVVRGKNNWRRIDQWTAEQGWQVLLISRFIPVIAFNLVNYAAGLTGVSWLTFAWTTALGILPAIVLMVLAGAHIDVMGWELWLLLAGAILLLCLVLRAKLATRPPTERDET